MDAAATDTRVKSLMRSENLSFEEANHLLRLCGWDVRKAQSVAAQRKLCESSAFGAPEPVAFRPAAVVSGQGSVAAAAPVAWSEPEKMDQNASNNSYANTHSLPKSSESAMFEEGGTPAPRLQRGMSNAFINSRIVMTARDILQKDAEAAMVAERGEEEDGKSFVQTTEFTFMLPDLSGYPEDFKAFLYKDLIDSSTLVSLEQTGHLNWWADIGVCQRLLPMVTSGDGNCLLHAASLGMWGLHDRQLILRKLLCDALTNGSSAEAFKRRWRYQQSVEYRQCNLVLDEDEWESDWKFLLQLSSSQPRSVGPRRRSSSVFKLERLYAGQSHETTEVVYESLEEMHVFVLAHILRRPIIVIAKAVLNDVHGEALAPIPFGGIYLPLEWDARQCHSAPLILTYDLSHFCALVPMEVSSPLGRESSAESPTEAIPLVNFQLELLPVHFAIDPGRNYDFTKNLDFSLSHNEKMNLIQNYFVVEQIPVPRIQREFDSYPDGFGTIGIAKAELAKSDSEESGGSAKDRNYSEDFDRKSAAKPMKFITKSFDTIGSKLKNITKSNKAGKLDRKGSFGVATQSTRMSRVATEMFENQSFVTCARLRKRKTGYQDVMVKNYIDSMREKFSSQQVKRREQNAEIRRRSIEKSTQRQSAPGGGFSLRPDSTRLDFDAAERPSGQRHSYAVTGSNSGGFFQRQDTIVAAGKSKFYTTASEDQSAKVNPPFESKKLDDTLKNEKRVGNTISEKGVLRYNKLDTMQLEAEGVTLVRSTEIDDPFDQRTKAGNSDFDGAPRRLNALTKPTAPNRNTLNDNNPYATKPLAENPSKRNVTSAMALPQNPTETRNSVSVGSLGRSEPNRDGGAAGDTRPCRAGNCKFFGTFETGFLCSHCFKSGRKARLCRSINCENECDPMQDNLCRVCYEKRTYSFSVQYPMAQTKF